MGLELGLIEINCTALSPGSSCQVPRVERERKRGKLARVTKNLEQITLQRNARRTALKIYSELDDSSLLGSLLPSLALFLPVRSLLFFGKRRPREREREKRLTSGRKNHGKRARSFNQPVAPLHNQPMVPALRPTKSANIPVILRSRDSRVLWDTGNWFFVPFKDTHVLLVLQGSLTFGGVASSERESRRARPDTCWYRFRGGE